MKIVEHLTARNMTRMSKKAINTYKLPVPKNLLQRIDRTSSPAHLGNLRNVIGLIAYEQTPVLDWDPHL